MPAVFAPHRARTSRGWLRKLLASCALLCSVNACLLAHEPSYPDETELGPEFDMEFDADAEPDAAAAEDAADPRPAPDAGVAPTRDAGPLPPSASDAGTGQALDARTEAGAVDARVEAGALDAGVDAGAPDAGSVPPSPLDAATTDAGADAGAKDAAAGPGCIALRAAMDDAVSDCFALQRNQALCLSATLDRQRVTALSLRATSTISQGEARRGLQCAYVALRAQCVYSNANLLEVCYQGGM